MFTLKNADIFREFHFGGPCPINNVSTSIFHIELRNAGETAESVSLVFHFNCFFKDFIKIRIVYGIELAPVIKIFIQE